MTPLAFLDIILPESGWKCLWTGSDRRHHWFDNNVAMAAAALRLDAAGEVVYHASAAFRSKSRTKPEVAAVKAFWLDIDAGYGKPHADETAAWHALQAFLKATGLPQPLVVASGGGLHVYWPLATAINPEEWRKGALSLSVLCAQHGLQTDAGLTANSVCLLRPPGTHNRKRFDAFGAKVAETGGPERPVRAGPAVAALDIDKLEILFRGAAAIPPSPPRKTTFSLLPAEIPAYARLKPGVALPRLGLKGYDNEPSNPDQIAQHCAQVRALPDAAGRLPEPLWYAVLGVLAHAGPAGDAAAQKWSSGDPRYEPGDTARKVQQAREAAGPTTCQRFESLNPATCQSCPFKGKITSPIQLGRPIPAATVAPRPTVDALPPLPYPYHWHGMKLAVTRKPTEDDPSVRTVLAEYAIYPSCLNEAERSHSISAVFRSWEPMQQDWRDFTLNLRDVLADGGGARLAEHGVAIQKRSWDGFRTFCVSMTNHYRGTQRYGTRFEQFGWKNTETGPAFVVGDEMLRPGVPPERVHGSPEVTRRAGLMKKTGTLAGWTAAAVRAFARPGMEAHAFVVACGFAAVLHRFTGAAGGAIVHAATIGTGTGKSFPLETAATAWGELPALRLKKSDTQVAKFIAIGTLGHLPVLFDELRDTRGPEGVEAIKDFVLHYTLGEDKARGAADGGLRSDNLPWSNLMLTAANISLVDTCTADGAETAQASRIFEFSPVLPKDLKVSEGDDLMRELVANRGHAGRAFVQALLERHAGLEDEVRAAVKTWETRLEGGPEQRYVLRLLACVAVTLTTLTTTGILPLSVEPILAWAEGIARENMQRIAQDRTPQPEVVLSRMINDLYPGTLVMPALRGMPLHEPHGPLIGRYQTDTGEALFDASQVAQWMQKNNYPKTQILNELVKLGIVKKTRDRRTLSAGWHKATGQIWCVSVDGRHPSIAEAFDAGDDGNVVKIRRM